MISIEEIRKPIAKEFEQFESEFVNSFSSQNELIKEIKQHILKKRGKQIRPLLTLLAAKSIGNVNENTIKCAISLEMLHTASLIHDDVVDESNERRGQDSVNAKWNNKISVLVGDFLLSQSLSIANETKNLNILNKITELGKNLSEGELLQITNLKNNNIIEEKYIEVIRKKTATLFETCTYTGAVSVNGKEEEIERIRKYGEIYGICFQIRDDIFDYISTKEKIGKPIGNDIKEGKITLPLLYALNHGKEKEKYKEIIKRKDFSNENVDKLINFSIENGGIEYAINKMKTYRDEGKKMIENIKNKEVKESLIKILDYTIIREN